MFLLFGLLALSFTSHLMSAELNLCLPLTIFSDSRRNLIRPWAATEVAAAIRAVQDINQRNCALVADCETLLHISDANYLEVNPYVLDLRTYDAKQAPPALLTCYQLGAEIALGYLTSSQSEASSIFGFTYDMPVVSHGATSTSLSDTSTYPYFSRTCLPDSTGAQWLIELFVSFGWKKASFLYAQDLQGEAYAQLFTSVARERDITVEAIAAFTMTESQSSEVLVNSTAAMSSIEALKKGTNKVVVLQFKASEVPLFLAKAWEMGLDVHSFSWFIAGTTVEKILSVINSDSTRFTPNLFRGLTSVELPFMEEKAKLLDQVHMSNFKPDEIQKQLLDLDGNPAPAKDTSGMMDKISGGVDNMETLYMYDAVWAAAAAYARVQGTNTSDGDSGRGSFGSRFMQALVNGTSFQGLSGLVEFDKHGDRKASGKMKGVVMNLQPDGKLGYTGLVVGHVDSHALEPEHVVDLNTRPGDVLMWPNGDYFPKVPSDGTASRFPWRMIVASVSACLAVLVLLSLCFVLRIWKLQRKVNALVDEGTARLDLESPLHKILDFLKRYDSRGKVPTREEAKELHDLVLANSNNLQAPDLTSQLKKTQVYSKGVATYILDFINATWRDDNSSQSSEYSPPDMNGCTFSTVEHTTVEEPNMVMKPCEISVPQELQSRIGSDFFLDTVSDESLLARCQSPMGAICLQSLEALGLSSLMPTKGVDKLAEFVLHIEGGYPDTLYHCKLHGADVTHRLVTILNRTGIAQAINEQDWVLNVAMLIAGAVHDYRHPQVNNNFLVQQESSMALQFNDQAVAENFALRESRKLLCEQIDLRGVLFGNDSHKDRWRKFGSTVIQSVLATDMSQHFQILGRFTTIIAENPKYKNKCTSVMWKEMSDEQRLLTLQMAIKAQMAFKNV